MNNDFDKARERAQIEEEQRRELEAEFQTPYKNATHYVNEDGEIVPLSSNLVIKDMNVEKRNQALRKKHYERENGIKKDNRSFSFANLQNVNEVADALTHAQLGYFLRSACLLGFDSPVLTERKSGKYAPVTKKRLREILGLGANSKRQVFNNFYKACIVNGFFLEDPKTKRIEISDRYFFRGVGNNRLDRDRIKVFHTTITNAYKVNTPKELGILYRILPYVHYNTNCIVKTRNAELDEMEPLTANEIAEVLGVTSSYVSKQFRAMKINGFPLVAQVTVLHEPPKYYINPHVFCAKSGHVADDTLLSLFGQREDYK